VSYRRYVAAYVLLVASVVSAQREPFTSASAVSFSISTDRNTYNRRENIIVKYQIKNISKVPLYVPKDRGETWCLGLGSGITFIDHVDVWLENTAGKDFRAGLVGGCGWAGAPPTFSERLHAAAVLLHPGEHFDGTIALEGSLFQVPSGGYRVEAKLDGWKEEQFSPEERAELSKMGAPFLGGETPASVFIVVIQ
jgi:hypothetical protein